VRGSPVGGPPPDSSEELAAAVAVGAAMPLAMVVSTLLALNWSWSLALAAAAAIAAAMVYLGRPGIAIAAVLLPFAVVDEGTDDTLPGLAEIGDVLYGDYLKGLVAPRDVLLLLAAGAALVFFPPAPERPRRLLGPVTWVFVATTGFILGGLAVGHYLLHNPEGSLFGLRPFYNCLLAAFVVWRVLRSMSRERAEKVVLGASLVVGVTLIAIGAVRVFGIAGTAVEIEGVPITFFDAAGPYALLGCVGVWGAALSDSRLSGPFRILLAGLVVSGLIVAITSQRRAILIGYAIAAAALLVLNAARQGGGILRSARVLVGFAAALAAVVVLVGVIVPGATDVFADRASSALSAAEESSSTDPSLQYRVDESDAVYALAGRNLWAGIGPTAGFTPVNGLSLPTDGSYTHNTYLTLPLRYGLWGILALAALVIGLVVTLARTLLRGPPRAAWVMAAALIALLPAIATAAFFTQTSRWAAIVGAIAGAFDALTDPPAERADAAERAL
jgi:O-Antigen ligase